MTIPDPIANRGDAVKVKNHRKFPPDFESGTVEGLRYENLFGDFQWTYDVVLTRKGKSGSPIRLYVGQAAIKKEDQPK